MKRLFVITLGYDEKFAMRCLVRNNIKMEDMILILTANINEKVRNAVNSIVDFLKKIGNENFRLESLEGDFFSVIERIKRILKEYERCKILINISGGMRWLAVSVIFSIFSLENIEKIEIEREDLGGVIVIEGEFIKLLKKLFALEDYKIKILREILRGNDNVEKLSGVLKKDVTTVRRYVQELEDFLIIEKRKPLIFRLKRFIIPFVSE